MEFDDLHRFRWPAKCFSCGEPIPKGGRGTWDRETKRATCSKCLGFLDRGTPGASAAKVAERRAKGRAPWRAKSWEKGRAGESWMGGELEKLRSPWLAVMHDRKIPGSPANIDHIVVGRAAIFIVDTKNYKGKVERLDCGGLFRRDWRLVVDGRDESALIEKMDKQVVAVREAAGYPDIPIIPVICFISSRWGWFAHAFQFGDVRVMTPKDLFGLVEHDGPLNTDDIRSIERRLIDALPKAA